jgi:hypothetical protein
MPRAVRLIDAPRETYRSHLIPLKVWGATAVDTALDWLKGKRPKSHIVDLAFTAVSSANAAKVL